MIDDSYSVYMHINKINQKKYIGITKNKPEERWLNGYGYKKQAFYNAIQKYGWDNFEHVILFDGLSQSEACQKEIDLISYYKTNNKLYGYNISSGGENGHNELWKDATYRESQIKKRKSIWSNVEFRENHAKKMKIVMESDKYKQKQAEKTRERWDNGCFDEVFCKPVMCLETGEIYKSATEASKATKISRTDIGKCCNKISRATHGYHWIFYDGKNYTEDERYLMIKQIGNSRGIKIKCVETGKIYNSIKEAADDVGGDNSSIGKTLKGRNKTSYGYHWVYY